MALFSYLFTLSLALPALGAPYSSCISVVVCGDVTGLTGNVTLGVT